MSNRFDNRSIDTFKRDIKFATMLEKYLFEGWLKRVKDKNSNVKVDSWKDNGCGNDGEFIEKGNIRFMTKIQITKKSSKHSRSARLNYEIDDI